MPTLLHRDCFACLPISVALPDYSRFGMNFYARSYILLMKGAIPNLQGSYFRQLDALRALAVSMVIFSHWPGYHQDMWSDDLFWFNGEIGVKLFFVISGFLITGILLEERIKADRNDLEKASLLKTFYIRRFLRIFPLYYATLFMAFALGHPDVLASWKWQVTYLSNFYYAIRGEYLGEVSHFWSLAVEEQFYFVWPLIILFLPKKWLLPFIACSICIAPLYRYIAMFILGQNDVTVTVIPISSMDCLSAGALLALLISRYTPDAVAKRSLDVIRKVGLLSVIGFFALNSFVSMPDEYEWYGIFISRLLLVPVLLALVTLFIEGFNGRTGRVMESPALSYLGKISYGIYIFHFFVPGVTYWLCTQIRLELSPQQMLILNLNMLIMVSSLSWYLFEKRLNQLKKHFPYHGKRPVVKASLKSETVSG